MAHWVMLHKTGETDGKVRVRIAPGPTGPFHIGRSRAAMLNWLFARHHGGTFVLRIEDTDQKRSKKEHLQSILESLRWLGLDWDEGPDVGGPYGPYFQMGRLESYRECAQRLVELGHAYACFCSPEELDFQRERARAESRPFRYPGTCRNLTASQQARKRDEGIKPVLRLKESDEGATSFDDLLLGPISVQNVELDDWVIVKSDGIPTYNFAVVIDDVTMHITHVIRGQEHISNTPRQLHVYRFLELEPPAFAHLPMILGTDHSKLSARHGAEPVTAYGQDGYLPEAIFNYVATLGSTYDQEREIFSKEELIERFDLQRVGKSGAIFDDEKLEWMNGVYIRALPLEEFVNRSIPFLQIRGLVGAPATPDEVEYASRCLHLEQERVRTLKDTPEAVEFFFEEDLVYDPANLVVKKSSVENARRVLAAAAQEIESLHPFDHATLEPAFRALAEKLDLKTGIVFGTIRVAITGRTAAPPLFDTMEVLGKARVQRRLERAQKFLEDWNPASET